MFVSLLSILLEATTPAASFIGQSSIFFALALPVIGAAYGTAKSGIGIAAVGQFNPHVVLKSLVPVIMAGMIAIYGLIIGVFLAASKIRVTDLTIFQSITSLGAGASVGFSGLSAGICIGIVGDAGVRAHAHQHKLFTIMVLVLVFAEALGLYGLIIALILGTKQ
eukprot:TRINITY_DN1692_c0_g1_i1.p1 TRINITY_DN1692_c0_g1~~TRINITY_DN1692_c0_g1_i1.p1  ORF type:complete len:165 (+),score=29.65 TRINITY_DN1692_c0_g1_i1:36-530(+)